MKIQCDVCNKNEASVFCSADEASLCDECDQRVHFANKLASKHQRFSLVQPSSSGFPICDICQEKRALLFCQQDRAILCRDCDIPLHTANEYTEKHNRFLLTGAQLAATVSDNRNAVSVSVTDCCDTTVPDFKSVKKPTSVLSEIPSSTTKPAKTTTATTSVAKNTSSSNNKSNSCTVNSMNAHQFNSGGSTTSNISDYLIDTLPGWHFDDFILDPPSSTDSSAHFGFCKSGSTNYSEVNEDILSYLNVENEKAYTSYSAQAENLWVPQAPAAASIVFGQPSMFQDTSLLGHHGTKHQEITNFSINKHSKKIRRDDAFTVPQITASLGSKRSRTFW